MQIQTITATAPPAISAVSLICPRCRAPVRLRPTPTGKLGMINTMNQRGHRCHVADRVLGHGGPTKLNMEIVRALRREDGARVLSVRRPKLREYAARYGVSGATISLALAGRTWKEPAA